MAVRPLTASSCTCGDGPLEIEVTNSYIHVLGAIGVDYTWLGDDERIVDAHRNATLLVRGARAHCDYTWEADGLDLVAVDRSGAVVTTALGAPMAHAVKVRAGCGGRSASLTLLARWVRREIRELLEVPGEMDRYLDTALVMWRTTQEEGEARYGPDFQTVQKLSMLHLENAGARDADHFHEGTGFVLQHVKLSKVFERSLQAIDPAVTLPYHDLSIESEEVLRGQMASTYDAIVWTPEIYGTIRRQVTETPKESWRILADFMRGNETAMREWAIADGRWAYEQLPAAPPGSQVNSFGLLRAPWNANPSPYLTRFALPEGYGQSPCSTLEEFLVQEIASKDPQKAQYGYWMYTSEFSLHGLIHGAIGGHVATGTGPIQTMLDAVQVPCCKGPGNVTTKYGLDVTECLNMTFNYFKEGKAAWRQHMINYPTNCTRAAADASDADAISSCQASCRSDPVSVGTTLLQWHMFQAAVRGMGVLDESFASCADEATLAALGETFCAHMPTTITGDHAITAAEVSFWPVHTVLERNYQVAILNGALDPDDANYHPFCRSRARCYDGEGALQTEGECCYGHGKQDRWFTSWTNHQIDGLTSAEAALLADPRSAAPDGSAKAAHPVYQHFRYAHCDSANITIFNATGARLPPAAPAAPSSALVDDGATGEGTGPPSFGDDDAAADGSLAAVWTALRGLRATITCPARAAFAYCADSTCARGADGMTAVCGCARATDREGRFVVGNATAFLIGSPIYRAAVLDLANGSAAATAHATDRLCRAMMSNELWKSMGGAIATASVSSNLVSYAAAGSEDFRNTTSCNATENQVATCMGAPCYDVAYDDDYELTCVCAARNSKSEGGAAAASLAVRTTTARACAELASADCVTQYTADDADLVPSLELGMQYGAAMAGAAPQPHRGTQCPARYNSAPLSISTS